MALPVGRSERLHQILDQAELLFSTRGYRRTRLSDVAANVGVTESALYRYFRGKDALFDQVLRRAAFGREFFKDPIDLPVPAPDSGATARFLKAAFRHALAESELEARLAGPAPEPGEAARRELVEVMANLFDVGTRYRVGARIMNASILETPELKGIWDQEFRGELSGQFAVYLKCRHASGLLRVAGDPGEWAALLSNVVAVHAIHSDAFARVGDGSYEARRSAVVGCAVAMLEIERSRPP